MTGFGWRGDSGAATRPSPVSGRRKSRRAGALSAGHPREGDCATLAKPEEPNERDTQLAAILVADVAGYSRLARADEEGTLARDASASPSAYLVTTSCPLGGKIPRVAWLERQWVVFEVEQFIALNLYELGKFGTDGRRVAVSDFVTRYNEIIDDVETAGSPNDQAKAEPGQGHLGGKGRLTVRCDRGSSWLRPRAI